VNANPIENLNCILPNTLGFSSFQQTQKLPPKRPFDLPVKSISYFAYLFGQEVSDSFLKKTEKRIKV
jgi:hypothetical protein